MDPADRAPLGEGVRHSSGPTTPDGSPPAVSADFRGVTETPGLPANPEQLAMLYARYHLGAELARDRDVLEVACGSGIGLAYIARRARRAVGGDVDPALLAIAKANCAGLADVSLMDALALPCDDEAFDVVVLLEAVYYLRDAPRFVEEARRVLRPGGYLYVCSANCEREAFNPSPMSVRYYPASTLGAMLREQGFEVGLSAAFPERADGIQGSLMSAAWRLAVRWRLVPRTMRGKSIVKRLLYRNSRPIPAVLTDGIAPLEPRVPVTADAPVRDFKVLYAVGRKAG